MKNELKLKDTHQVQYIYKLIVDGKLQQSNYESLMEARREARNINSDVKIFAQKIELTINIINV